MEFQGKSIDNNIKEYLNSNNIINEKMININIDRETNENLNSIIYHEKIIESNESNKNLDIFLSDDLDVKI